MQLIKEIEQEAYQKGWDDAVAKIVTTAAGIATLTPHKDTNPSSLKPSMPQYSTPIIDMVLQIVTERPGLRGVDVVKEITKRDPEIPLDVANNTGRAGLLRLRKREKITQRNRKWYPAPEKRDDNISGAQKYE